MIKTIISVFLIVISVFVYAKLSKPLINSLKFKESQNLALKRKITNYQGQIASLKRIKNPSIFLKKQKISTYMFTLLSFVNYLKNKGLKASVKLNRIHPTVNSAAAKDNIKFPALNKKAGTVPEAVIPVRISKNTNSGFKSFESNSKYSGVKYIHITLTFKGYPGVQTVLSIMNKLYMLFPIAFANFEINSKTTVINFNLYSFKGV